MGRFEHVLAECGVDGMWLDYRHSHASWEQAEPNLPDTCFCDRCLTQFTQDTGLGLPDVATPVLSAQLPGEHRERWTQWRCDVFTDWVRESREITDRGDGLRPGLAQEAAGEGRCAGAVPPVHQALTAVDAA